ncbi:hypothetical protein [Methanosarcina horonobensis]|uniref:hypothetical protein n=1 Tax=Methanosarcina horonobensis TaxID=418008 RepID=UPI0022B8D8FC|nr:hypothetical protein [Methanosarcina horonobensis]
MGALLFASGSGSVIDPTSLSEEELYSVFWEGFTNNIPGSLALILVFFLLGMFLQAFFTAGAIGMAKKSFRNRRYCFLGHVKIRLEKRFQAFSHKPDGRPNITCRHCIFSARSRYNRRSEQPYKKNPEVPVQGIGVLTIGILLWAIYLLAINIALSLAPYALIIDELEPLDALKSGYRFFRTNKLDVFFIWIISVGLAFFNGFVGEFLGSQSILISGITYFVPIFILQPLTAVLWTRLYMVGEERELYNPYDLLSDPEKF